MQIMRILIANDDGIYAAGIKAIAAEFSKKHQVMVVAPDHDARRQPFYKSYVATQDT